MTTALIEVYTVTAHSGVTKAPTKLAELHAARPEIGLVSLYEALALDAYRDHDCGQPWITVIEDESSSRMSETIFAELNEELGL
jgi:hypothetical protein